MIWDGINTDSKVCGGSYKLFLILLDNLFHKYIILLVEKSIWFLDIVSEIWNRNKFPVRGEIF